MVTQCMNINKYIHNILYACTNNLYIFIQSSSVGTEKGQNRGQNEQNVQAFFYSLKNCTQVYTHKHSTN